MYIPKIHTTYFSYLSIEIIRDNYVEMVNILTHGGSSIRGIATETCSLIFAIFQGALQSMINLMKGIRVQRPVESELLRESNSDPASDDTFASDDDLD